MQLGVLPPLENLGYTQGLLGPLPQEIAARLPPNDVHAQDADAYSDDALFLAIRDNANKESQEAEYKFPEEKLRKLADLLKKMLAYRAADRITAAEALKHAFFH